MLLLRAMVNSVDNLTLTIANLIDHGLTPLYSPLAREILIFLALGVYTEAKIHSYPTTAF